MRHGSAGEQNFLKTTELSCITIGKSGSTGPMRRMDGGSKMKRSLMVLGVGAVMVLAAGSILRAQKTASSKASGKKVTYISASSAEFKPGPTKGVSMAALRGDANK